MHGLTQRPGDSNVTDSLFKETGLLSSPAFSRAALAQAICFILIQGLKMLFFSRLPKYDKQPLCSSPLFTACSMLCCKIFTVKLSTMLATRPAFTVWWHSPSVYAPSAPHQCLLAARPGNRPTSRDLPEQFKHPTSFQAWHQARVKFFFFFHCPAKALPKVSEFQLGMTSEKKTKKQKHHSFLLQLLSRLFVSLTD